MPLTVPPKPAAQRQRRNRTTTAATLEAPPARKVPLPERDAEHPWHPLTLATWEVWWASPMTAEWVDADVPGLIETAQMVDDFWRASTTTDRARLRAEIRMSSREYGLSSLSRRQLQWEIKRIQATERPVAAVPRRRRPSRNILSVLDGSRHTA
jgi:hypothetical protein